MLARMRRLANSDLPYDDRRDPDWEAGIDDLPWNRRHDDTCSKHGLCPRCEHPIGFVEEAPVRPGDPDEHDQGRFEECNCGVVHPGTPEGRIGCGANGLIRRARSQIKAGNEGTSR